MLIRKIILLFFVNLSILLLPPVAYAEANIDKININTADALILENLRGIGPKKAAAIIDFRDKNGMFESANDLKKINGIGQKTVDKNLDIIEVALIPEEIIEDSEENSKVENTDNSQESDTEEVVEVVEVSKDTEKSTDAEESTDTEVKKAE
ncbi:MAG: helix-hairpin-helix domain-containing protein [Candidatus Marithrix sp.]